MEKKPVHNYYTILATKWQSTALDEQLALGFKKVATTIRYNTASTDYDSANTPMTLLFPVLRPQIINLILAFTSPIAEPYHIITTLDVYHFKWYTAIFDRLNMLAAKDMMLWFCFHIPYFDTSRFNHPDKSTILQETYIKLLDYASTKWLKSNYFTEDEFLYISNETCFPYAASYHWDNNRVLLSKYCTLIRIICGSWINYTANHLVSYPKKHNSKPSICFISDCLVADSSVFRDRAALIGKLDKSRYDVFVASFIPKDKINHKIASRFISKLGENYIYLGSNISTARRLLEPYAFDIIVYPDIGMKVRPTMLAYSRLAPTQINTWGHSETSGIDTIDYFISSKYFETDISTASKFYSEKLVLMESLSTYYVSPSMLFLDNQLDARDVIRSRLGFQPSDRIYGCLQTFYKISPVMIKIIAGILSRDCNAVVILSNCFPYPKCLAAQLIASGGEMWNGEFKRRIRWFPPLDKKKYLELVNICDLHLDTHPFGGCNTSYDAFDFNIPVITMPTNKISGRFTFGLYKKMDTDTGVDIVKDCVVRSTEEYITRAIEIANNGKLRAMISRKIESGKKAIFMEDNCIKEYENFFKKLYK